MTIIQLIQTFCIFTELQAARLDGHSTAHAWRLRCKRYQARGLLYRGTTVAKSRYWAPTKRARQLYGPRAVPQSGSGITALLGIAEYFSLNPQHVLMTPDRLERSFAETGLDLSRPGIQRHRFFWLPEAVLSQVLVDLTLPSSFQAHRYAKRLVNKRDGLRSKSSGWNTLIDASRFTFTVLSPIDRVVELTRECDRYEINVNPVTIPMLQLAWGVAINA